MSAGTADHHQGSAIPGTSGERNNDEETMMNMDCNMFSLPLAFSQALVDIIAHQQTPVNSEIVQKELTEWSNSFQNEMCEANCSGQQDSNCSLMNSSVTTSIIDIESSTRPTHQKAEKRKKPKCERKEVVSMLETSPTHQLEIKNDMFGQCNKILAEFLTNPEMARFFASQLQNVISADTDSLSTDLISNVFTQNVPSVSNEISQGDQSMANELSHHPSGNANALLDLIHLLFNNNNSNNNNNVITDFSGYFNHSKIPESMVNDGAFLNNSNRDGLTAWLISQMTQMYMMESVNCLPPTHDNERQTPPFDDSGIGEMGDEDELDKSSPTCQVVAVPKSQTNNRSKHKRSNSSLKQSTNSKGGNQTNFECTEMQLPSQKAPRKYKKRKPKTRGEDTNAEVLQSFKQEHGSSTSFVNTLTTEDNQFQAAISSYLTQFASFMASCIPPEMLQSIDSQFFAEIVGNLLSSTIAANFPAWIQFQQRDSQEVFQLPQQQSTQFPELLESFIRAAAATGSAEIASSSLAENFLCQAPTTSLEQPISEGKPIFNQSPANAPVFTLAPQSRSTTNTFSDPLNISLNTLESSSETASTGFCIPPSPFLLMATNTKHLNGSSDHQPSVPNVPLLQFGLGTEKDMEMMMGQQQERRMPAALPRKTTIKQDIENGDPLLLTQETDNNQLNLSHDDGRNNDFDSKQRKNRPRAATAKALVASASANGTFCSPTVPVANNMKGICVANVLHSAANGNILASDAPLEELAELEEFANLFKKQRIKHGFTQGDVGVALGKRYGTDFSQTTISRFEALNLSYKNMCKLRPLLKEWLEETSELIADGATVSDILDGSSVSERAARNEEPSADQTYAYKNGADERPVGTVTPTPPMPFKRRRKRTNLDNGQKLQLNAYFRLDSRPDNQTLTKIANILDLDNDVVRVWFCNRRQKVRKTD